MIKQKEMQEVVEQSFERYAGSVILNRAICDVRDMMKPAARMLIYSQVKTTKNTPDKPYVKSARVVGDCLGHYYEHGDSSCYGTYMRMSKPFAMRYPLETCQGNNGTVITTGDEAASRYTELRLAPIAENVYSGLDKNAIDEWADNFDETEQYPRVMPSIGFYNLVNGTIGLGVAISASIPQFNIKDVNNSIIRLINNPDLPDESVIVMPDFATGGLLINPEEVAESLKNGKGKGCRLRAKMEYVEKGNYIHVSELPYSVYTSTVTSEIKALVESQFGYGIESINDNSGKTVDYNIYLSKGVNPKIMMMKLYKDTSLESYFSINMWALDKGRFPKVFSFKNMLLAYIDHIRECKRKEIEFDLNKCLARENILNGLLLAVANIDEVVTIIRKSDSGPSAAKALTERFGFNETQVKSILDLKLVRLTNLEAIKLENELEELKKKIEELKHLLDDSKSLDVKLIQRLEEVSKLFGDLRRTTIVKNFTEETSDEPIPEPVKMTVHFSHYENYIGRLATSKKRTAIKFKKGGLKLSIDTDTSENILIFTSLGKVYVLPVGEINPEEEGQLRSKFDFEPEEVVVGYARQNVGGHFIFITKNGMIKKSKTEEYAKMNKESSGIKLTEGDSVAVVLNVYEEPIVITSAGGQLIQVETAPISAIGRLSQGVAGMRLNDGDYVSAAAVVTPETINICTIIEPGYIKQTKATEFPITGRNTKGKIAHKVGDGDKLVEVFAIEPATQFIRSRNYGNISIVNIPVSSRNTKGSKIK